MKNLPVFSTFLFLLIVACLYGVAFQLAPEKTLAALDFGLKILVKLSPVLLLVFLLMFLSTLYVKPRWIQNHLGQKSGFKGMLMAMIGGIISMGPIYVWYSMLSDFKKNGMRPALIAIFLYSRSIKLPLLPLMVFYFGTAYTVLLSFYMLIFSLLSGLFTERLAVGKRIKEEDYGNG